MTTEDTNIEKGFVSAFDSFKGFGFIRREKGKDVFFFYDEIEEKDRDLSIGDTVAFAVVQKAKGPRAYQIKKLNSN